MKDYAAYPELKQLLDAGVSPELLEKIDQAISSSIHFTGNPLLIPRFARDPFLIPEGYFSLWEATSLLSQAYQELADSEATRLTNFAMRMMAHWAAFGFLRVHALDRDRFGRVPAYCWSALLDACGPALSAAHDLEETILSDKLVGSAFGELEGMRPVVAYEAIPHAWRCYAEEAQRREENTVSPDVSLAERMDRAARTLVAASEQITAKGIARTWAREKLGAEASAKDIAKQADSKRHLVTAADVDRLRRALETGS